MQKRTMTDCYLGWLWVCFRIPGGDQDNWHAED